MKIWIVVIAAAGGVIVFFGLLIEKISEKLDERFLGKEHEIKAPRGLEFFGWVMLMFGISVEIGVAIWSANDAWQTKQAAIKNNPLNQPVSDVSAVVETFVNATNFDAQKPITLENTWLNLYEANTASSLVWFHLVAKEVRRYDHLDNFATHHVAYYGIAVEFERSKFPDTEWNDINNTNDLTRPSITVTNAISKITGMQTYIEFIPKNTEIVKGTMRVFFNGFLNDFEINSNSVNKQVSEWNPDMPGLFLSATNEMP